MNRRKFLSLGGLGTLGIAASAIKTDTAGRACPQRIMVPVRRANGLVTIVGVAMESVQAGDVLEVAVHGGPVWVRWEGEA